MNNSSTDKIKFQCEEMPLTHLIMNFEHCVILSTPSTFLLPYDSNQNDQLHDHLNMANQILNSTKKK